jgi:hypothetical protein
MKILATSLALACIASSAEAADAISAGNRAAYCRGEVARQYGTKPMYVKTGKLAKAKDGTTSVSGTVDEGSAGAKKFKCRFDADGKFVDVVAPANDGD